MATNLRIDNALVLKAIELGGHRTKREAVKQALVEYVQRLEQRSICSLFGTVEYDLEYNYKRQRQR